MNVEINIQVILDRLKEPSTYAAVAAPLLVMGMTTEHAVSAFAGSIGMIASIIGMALGEGKKEKNAD